MSFRDVNRTCKECSFIKVIVMGKRNGNMVTDMLWDPSVVGATPEEMTLDAFKKISTAHQVNGTTLEHVIQ